MASFSVKIIRAAFGMAEHLSPALAGRLAFEMFCRTRNPETLRDRERRVVEQAARFMAEARRHRLTTRSGTVMAFEFKPLPGTPTVATVLVVHGWDSRTEHMRWLVDGYRTAGYRVIALDLPGHGHSSGRRLNLVNAVEAVAAAATWFGPFAAIVGHSFGGAVALNAAAGSIRGVPAVATDRLVLISAPSSMPAIFDYFGDFLKLGPRTQTRLAAQVERIAGHPLEDYVGAVQLASLPIPTLVIHAPDDREVSADNATMFANAGDHVSLHWARGLGHRRILADPDVTATAVDFLAARRNRLAVVR